MRKLRCVAALLIVALLAPSPASAWGFAGHRYIMGRAIELLPPELKPFFERSREELVIRAIDPDLWRGVGWEEEPHHFLNFGAREFGPFPFAELPREYGAALEKFGANTLDRLGKLPWREAEAFGNLRRGFEAFKRESPYAPADLVLFAAMAGHYIQDAHQPLHASNNYDGQLTGNTGIHSRFERELVERFLPRMTIAPAAPTGVRNPRDFAFDTLLASYQLVEPILAADKAAIGTKDVYDDAYYETFFAKVKPIIEKRLADSITATAAIIIGAWEAAGKPVLREGGARPPEKVRK